MIEETGAERSSESIGEVLARARQAQGISVADIAGRLRLHPRQVSALEEERFEQLPEVAFVRGFLRNYAKELRIDAKPLLAALETRFPSQEWAQTRLAGPAAEVRLATMERRSRFTVMFGAVGVIAVLGLIGWAASMRVQPALQLDHVNATGPQIERKATTPATGEVTAAPSGKIAGI